MSLLKHVIVTVALISTSASLMGAALVTDHRRLYWMAFAVGVVAQTAFLDIRARWRVGVLLENHAEVQERTAQRGNLDSVGRPF